MSTASPLSVIDLKSVQSVIDDELKKGDTELITKSTFPALSKQYALTEDKVHSIYKIFSEANHSKSGLMSLEELESLLANMTDGTVEYDQLCFIMEKFDADNDGCLHFEEFLHAFVSTPLMKVSHLTDELKHKGGGARDQIQESGMRLQPEDWVQLIGCKAGSVISFVEKELSEAGSCLAMPWVFLMFIVYALSVSYHLDHTQLHSVDHAIFFDITENANFAFSGDIPYENGRMGHKNIFDVNSVSDFWSWFDLGITPLFWAEGWEISEARLNVATQCMPITQAFADYGWNTSSLVGDATYSDNRTLCPDNYSPPERPKAFYANSWGGTYLYYNSIVAGVRLRQERSGTASCPNSDNELRSSLHRGLCLADEGYSLKPELHTAFRTRERLINRTGGKTQYLPSLASQSSIRSMLHKLENEVWFGPYTSKIEVLLTTYNANLDAFTATYIWLFINRGGHFFKVVKPLSTFLSTYRHLLCYVFDSMLLLLCVKIAMEEFSEIYANCKRFGVKRGLEAYVDPANLVDWLSVVSYVFLAVFWLSHVNTLHTLQETLRKADPLIPGSFGNVGDRDAFYEAVDDWAVSTSNIVNVLTVFPFIIGMRFFEVFSLQPRLGVVTATLQHSFRDIIHFTVVFLSIFLIFVCAAMILFGQTLDEFTNFGRAMMSVFLIMSGEFDWSELIRVGRQQAALFFMVFFWLVNLVMLNMLLAIIMDVYTEVKAQIGGDSETMWSQMSTIFVRWCQVRKGSAVRMQTVLKALEKHCASGGLETDEERLTIAGFMEMVPNMPEDQAIRILSSAFKNAERISTGGSMSDMSSRVQHIFKGTHVLHHAVTELMHMTETMAEMINANFAELRHHTLDRSRGLRKMTHSRSQVSVRSCSPFNSSPFNVAI